MFLFDACCANSAHNDGSTELKEATSPSAAPPVKLSTLAGAAQAEFGGLVSAAPATAEAAVAQKGGSPAAAAAAAGPPVACDFVLKVHNATLSRSFAKFGWMDPYAVISADSKEVSRTKPAKSAHKLPKWDTEHQFESGSLPGSIMVAVWDKNNFHRDVFCGAVTIPLEPTMGSLEEKDFTLTKKEKPTGTVRLTLKAILKEGQEAAVVPVTLPAGGEVDAIVGWSQGTVNDVQVTLQESPDHPAVVEEKPEDTKEGEEEPAAASQTTGGGSAASLMGTWKCVDTWGLEEFLKATGVGVFQRKIAMAARWPGWDFSNEGTHILFINHSAIGDLKEEIPLGKEYAWKDGHKNDFMCTATWTPSAEGGTLTIDRKGKVGDYMEERKVTGGKLDFILIHSNGVKWGRSFERA